jgi:hypothetical protein
MNDNRNTKRAEDHVPASALWFDRKTENLAFFHSDRHRSAEVAQTLFGEDFDGTLVRDRYASYNGDFFRP